MPEPKENDTQLNDEGELEVWNIDPSTGRWAWLRPTPKGLDDPNSTRASDVTLPANGAPDDQMYDTMKASAEKASAYPPMMDPLSAPVGVADQSDPQSMMDRLSAPVGVTDQGETAVATDIDMDSRDGASQGTEGPGEVMQEILTVLQQNQQTNDAILSHITQMNSEGIKLYA